MTAASRVSFAQQSNVRMYGRSGPVLLLGHGFCTDSNVFQHQVQDLSRDHRVITYDLAGFGASDPALWDAERHSHLEGYAQDLVRLLDELDVHDVVLVGASMSGMIGLLASLQRPEQVRALVFIGASPRYLNDGYYKGGFERAEVDAFYTGIDTFDTWSEGMAGLLVGAGSLALREVAERVSRVRPEVARVVARAIFDSDYRGVLRRCAHPVLLMQSAADSVVPEAVATYLHVHLRTSRLVKVPGVGHIPHRTQPRVFNQALRAFMLEVFAQAPAD